MSRVPSPSGSRTYGVARVCRAWGIARATVYRHRSAAAADTDPQPPRSPVRRGPVGACPDAEAGRPYRGGDRGLAVPW